MSFDLSKFEHEYTQLLLEGFRLGYLAFRFQNITFSTDTQGTLSIHDTRSVKSTDAYIVSQPITVERGDVVLHEKVKWNENGGKSYTVYEASGSSTSPTSTFVDLSTTPTASITCPWGFQVWMQYSSDLEDEMVDTSVDCFGVSSTGNVNASVKGMDGTYQTNSPYMFITYDTARKMMLNGKVQEIPLNIPYENDPQRHKQIKSVRVYNEFPVTGDTYRVLSQYNTVTRTFTPIAYMFCIDDNPFDGGFQLMTSANAFERGIFVNPARHPQDFIDNPVLFTQDVFGIYGGNTLDFDFSHEVVAEYDAYREFYNHYMPDIEGLDPSTSPAVQEFLIHAATMNEFLIPAAAMNSDESNIVRTVAYILVAAFVLLTILLVIFRKAKSKLY